MLVRHEIGIEGMRCASCAAAVSRSLRSAPGVITTGVTSDPAVALVEAEREIPDAELAARVAAAGEYRIIGVRRSGAEATPLATQDPASHVRPLVAPPGEGRPKLFPLYLITAYVTAVAAVTSVDADGLQLDRFMGHLMAGFFLVFSFFKFLDLKGFADAYRTYDVIARSWPAWGFVYPFLEAALGFAYVLRVAPRFTDGVTLIVMLVGAAGIFRALRRGGAVRCACLGTALDLPMTTISLTENLVMAAMAAVMTAAG